MKRRKLGILAVLTVVFSLIGCAGKEIETWKVTCPWAETGVAGRVNEKTAEVSANISKTILLEAESIKGDADTVNQWVAQNDAGTNGLVPASF